LLSANRDNSIKGVKQNRLNSETDQSKKSNKVVAVSDTSNFPEVKTVKKNKIPEK